MNIAILGDTHWLGRYLADALTDSGHRPVAAADQPHPGFASVERGMIRDALHRLAPDAVAYVGTLDDLARCEAEPELAWRVNSHGPREAAQWCAQLQRPLVHVSSDTVFRGDRGGYREDDEVDPLNVHAVSMFLGEREVLARGGTVVRTNRSGGSGPLASSMARKLRAGETVRADPTAMANPLAGRDLADAVRLLLENPVEGLLHLGGDPVSEHDVALLVLSRVGGGRVEAAPTRQHPFRQPLDTTLCVDRTRQFIAVSDRGWEAATLEVIAAAEGVSP